MTLPVINKNKRKFNFAHGVRTQLAILTLDKRRFNMTKKRETELVFSFPLRGTYLLHT